MEEAVVFDCGLCANVAAACSKAESDDHVKDVTEKLCATVLTDTNIARDRLDTEDNSILTLLLRAAQYNVSTKTFNSQCQKFGIPNVVGEVYSVLQNKRAKLRDVLCSIGWRPSEIVDMDWKIVYHVRSGQTTRDDDSLFMISLMVADCGATKLRTIEFSATLQELQDLLWRLKEAGAAVNKLAQLQK